MYKLSPVILLSILVFTSCTRFEIEADTPKCVKDKIVDFNKDQTCSDIKVDEYTFQGISVYVFDSGTCGADMQSSVIDTDCNNLGALGGLAGNIEINGESFESAVFVKTIWEK